MTQHPIDNGIYVIHYVYTYTDAKGVVTTRSSEELARVSNYHPDWEETGNTDGCPTYMTLGADWYDVDHVRDKVQLMYHVDEKTWAITKVEKKK